MVLLLSPARLHHPSLIWPVVPGLASSQLSASLAGEGAVLPSHSVPFCQDYVGKEPQCSWQPASLLGQLQLLLWAAGRLLMTVLCLASPAWCIICYQGG